MKEVEQARKYFESNWSELKSEDIDLNFLHQLAAEYALHYANTVTIEEMKTRLKTIKN